jgi:Flp pilus assembly protein TadD
MAPRFGVLLSCFTIACALAAASPGFAQAGDPVAELDALSQGSAQVGPGVALARRQIGEGDLMAAVATLERVLMGHADADTALLLHAALLCRLDDRDGARAELVALTRPVPGRDWGEVTAACGPMPRPGTGG